MAEKGITLAEIKAARASVEIDLAEYGFEGSTEPLKVYFKPNFWNDDTKAKFLPTPGKALDQSTSAEQINATIVAEAVTGWNLTDGGKPVAVTVKTLRETLGDAVTDGLLTKMLERVHPNRRSSQS